MGRMAAGMRDMSARSVETGFPFKSLVPLWGRQVPYTMIKFVGFYQTQEMVYEFIEKKFNRPKSSINSTVQLGITFGCGYWAGIFCAIATQPMDNLVSMKGIPENRTKGWGQMASEMGTVNLFMKGLGTRIIMIGTLTGLQWWIYGNFKTPWVLAPHENAQPLPLMRLEPCSLMVREIVHASIITIAIEVKGLASPLV